MQAADPKGRNTCGVSQAKAYRAKFMESEEASRHATAATATLQQQVAQLMAHTVALTEELAAARAHAQATERAHATALTTIDQLQQVLNPDPSRASCDAE